MDDDNQAASSGSSLYSYFGFSSSNAAQDYLTATSSDRSVVVKTEQYTSLKRFYTEMYVLGYNL